MFATTTVYVIHDAKRTSRLHIKYSATKLWRITPFRTLLHLVLFSVVSVRLRHALLESCQQALRLFNASFRCISHKLVFLFRRVVHFVQEM